MRRAWFRRVALLVAAVSAAGVTRAVAGAPAESPTPPGPGSRAAAATSGSGYWLIGADGNVYPFDRPALGSLGATPPARPIVGAAATPGGGGYWLAGADGGIFAFGDAGFFGSTGDVVLNRPIVGMAATPSGRGYWLVASDGGIFAFGDAGFFGSTGDVALNRPIVGMAATPSGRGYWLVASDGGIFSFGDATFFGSTGDIRLNQPITGMSASMSGRGYRFVASDGGLFSFGDAPYAGSAAGRRLPGPIVGMAGSPTGNGYWLAGGTGAVDAFGDVADHGDVSGAPLPAPVVAIIAPPRAAAASGTRIEPQQSSAPTGPSAPPGSADGSAPPGPGADTGTGRPVVPAPGGAFEIALLGDTGYSIHQDELLLKTRTAISSRHYAFVVHDGDIQHPSEDCTDERLKYVHDTFDGFTAPFIYTPGDNEWADCPDPDDRLAAIRRHFFSADQSLGQHRLTLTRQAAPFVENARWVAGNVVFATLNVPGPTGRDSGAPGLHDANIRWLNAAFDTAESLQSPGVMIVWQDDPFEGASDSALEDVLIRRTNQFGKPVVLVHGDTHVYRLGKRWSQAPALIELETFALDNTDWWVEVRVDPASPAVFSFEKEQS